MEQGGGSSNPVEPPVTLYTLTINPTPSDAIVTLTCDGYTQNGNSISVPSGSSINYSVSKDGYIEINETYVIESDYVIDVTLSVDDPDALPGYILQPVSETVHATGYTSSSSTNYKWYWSEENQNGYLRKVIFDTPLEISGRYVLYVLKGVYNTVTSFDATAYISTGSNYDADLGYNYNTYIGTAEEDDVSSAPGDCIFYGADIAPNSNTYFTTLTDAALFYRQCFYVSNEPR